MSGQLTSEIESYFKNSKIRDKNGKLLVCYHGTPRPGFSEFNPQENKSQFGRYKFNHNNVNYFTTNIRTAVGYTDLGVGDVIGDAKSTRNNIYACYLNIVNPYIVTEDTKEEIVSWRTLKDKNIRNLELKTFNDLYTKWTSDQYYDVPIADVLDELNIDLFPFNVEVVQDENTSYYNLIRKANNSMYNSKETLMYQYETVSELFEDKDRLASEIIGDDDDDYYYTIDYLINWVLMLNVEGSNYDGIIVKDILDVGPRGDAFSDKTTDIITLKSANQIKAITNKNPTTSNNINESMAITFGDLDIGVKTDDVSMMNGRDTGHFGTGFYFVGENGPYGVKDGKLLYDYDESRPIYEIDLSKYKLYKPKDNEAGYKLFKALKNVNRNFIPGDDYSFGYYEAKQVKHQLEEIEWDDKLCDKTAIHEFIDNNGLERYLWIDVDQLDRWYIDKCDTGKVFNELTDAIDNKKTSVVACKSGITDLSEIFGKSETEIINMLTRESKKHTSDTLSTNFMKDLGYEGVDVTELNHDAQGLSGLDNFTFGTVVYDLKPGTYKRIMEPRKQSAGMKEDFEFPSSLGWKANILKIVNWLFTSTTTPFIRSFLTPDGRFINTPRTTIKGVSGPDAHKTIDNALGRMIVGYLGKCYHEYDNLTGEERKNFEKGTGLNAKAVQEIYDGITDNNGYGNGWQQYDDSTDGSWVLEELVGCVRLNGGIADEFYMVLPAKSNISGLTEKQYQQLTAWLDKYYTDELEVEIREDYIAKYYCVFETPVDDLVKKIRAYYNSGELKERYHWKPSRTKAREFAQTMADIDEFCKENNIIQSANSDSYYFTLNNKHYRVSNHSVEASNKGAYDWLGNQTRGLYHEGGRDSDTIYINASKTRIKEIYNDLKNGYKLNGNGYRVFEDWNINITENKLNNSQKINLKNNIEKVTSILKEDYKLNINIINNNVVDSFSFGRDELLLYPTMDIVNLIDYRLNNSVSLEELKESILIK